MPALVLAEDKNYWFDAGPQKLESLLQHVEKRVIRVEPAAKFI